MTRYLGKMTKRMTAILGSGMLLQAGGCDLDTTELAAGLFGTIANNLLAGYVYGAFNLVA